MPTPPVTCNAPVLVDVAFVTVVTSSVKLDLTKVSPTVSPVIHVILPGLGADVLNSCLPLISFCE